MLNLWPAKSVSKHLLITSVLLSSLLTACDSKQSTSDASNSSANTSSPAAAQKAGVQQDKTGWQAHIEQLPSEFVSANKSISIEFTHPVAGEQALNVANESLLAIEPNIEFKSYFISDRKIQVDFNQPLERGTQYKINLFAQSLSGVDNSLEAFAFPLQAFKQDYSLQIDGLNINSQENLHSIVGNLTTNDAVAISDVEKFLQAEQQGQALAVEWQTTNDTHYQFTVNGIVRAKEDSQVILKWAGKHFAVEKSGEKVIDVPSLTSFEVTSIIGKQTSGQFIEVYFSEPLKPGQNLKGLVHIDDKAVKSVRIDGNKLKVFAQGKLSGDINLLVDAGIKSNKGIRTTSEVKKQLTFLSEKPGVRFFGNKYIIPKQDKMSVTIEAVNVDSVQITAYRTPVKNIGQFLQNGSLKSRRADSRASAVQWRKTYALPEIPKDKWQKYDLSLENISQEFGNDLLGLEIKIGPSNIILDCGSERPDHDDSLSLFKPWQTEGKQSVPSWAAKYYNSQGYSSWSDRENPCKDYFYRHSYGKTKEFRYFTASNIGLIAKMASDHKMLVVATNINSAEPLDNVQVTAYNYQHQPVGEIETDSQGMAEFTPVSAPYYLIAKYDDDLSFIRLNRNEVLSTNIFDVGGSKSASGVKGFFYGERGIWRPGDDIYLNFLVLDKAGNFPQDYPLTLDFFDPKGIKKHSITQTNPVNGFYHYKLSTDENDSTGNWRAVIRYGNQYFDKKIPVEAIVPNRLKIELNFPDRMMTSFDTGKKYEFFSQWLSGAPANNLKADLKMQILATKTKIAGFDGFEFDDLTRKVSSKSRTLLDSKLTSQGLRKFRFIPNISNTPGQVTLNFTARVFEKSGNFSTQYLSKKYNPYDRLIGMSIPQGNGWNNSISRDESHDIAFLSVDSKGERLKNTQIDFTIHQLGWRWWWDYSQENTSSYINSQHSKLVVDESLTTDKNGNTRWQLDGTKYDWGRYLLRACNANGGHCSSKVVYLGWSSNNKKGASGETQLILSTDKSKYKVGETAYLTLPKALTEKNAARYLLTLETGSKILSQKWINDEIKDGRVAIELTPEMNPNVYAHVTLIQAYQGKTNDSPIRMYGIAPIMVSNDQVELKPIIEAAKAVAPESEFEVTISESQGREMTYTLAVVDEGLLGVTNYRTPNPMKSFYKREALGVLTWDLYDLLAQTDGGTFNSLITLGGGDSGDDDSSRGKKRRFPPVVKFLGPFTLAESESATHKIQLPEYLGAIRVMVVAGDQQQAAYGIAEKTIKVTQPLTMLATLPRVLGPNEEFSLPVNIFANDKTVKDVTLEIEANELFEFDKELPSVSFSEPGDKIVNIPFKTSNAVGTGTVTIKAISNGSVSRYTVNINVRSANSPQIISQSAVISGGETKSFELQPNGMLNTNSNYFQVSRIPELDLASRLDYLIGYPHGCLEQTTSKLFSQLYLKDLTDVSEQQGLEIDSNINQGIRKLTTFKRTGNSYSYWPNGSYANYWAQSYAAHFIVAAKKAGYIVPSDTYWDFIHAQQSLGEGKVQRADTKVEAIAYALYTLALADKEDFDDMNRLKEKLASLTEKNPETSNRRIARWLLAAAYAKAGVADAATELMSADDNSLLAYRWPGASYGSTLRDQSILMLVQSEMKDDKSAWESALMIADQFKQNSWYSTQSTSWAFISLANYFTDNKGEQQNISYRMSQGGKQGEWQALSISSPIFKQSLGNSEQALTVEIKNQSEQHFYTLVANQGTPANTDEQAQASKIGISARFTDMQGKPLNIDKIPQGTDFKAIVTVTKEVPERHVDLSNIALTMTMPSGWQISNDRLEGKKVVKGLEYQDIRDDRIISYFALGSYSFYHGYLGKSMTIEATLNASFKGRFYLPGFNAASMYDKTVHASMKGQWVEVVDAIDE